MLVACPFCRSVLEVDAQATGGMLCFNCRNMFAVSPPATRHEQLAQAASATDSLREREPVPVPFQPLEAAAGPPRKSSTRPSRKGRAGESVKSVALVVQVVLGGLAGLAAAYGALQFFGIGKQASKESGRQSAPTAQTSAVTPLPSSANALHPLAGLPVNNEFSRGTREPPAGTPFTNSTLPINAPLVQSRSVDVPTAVNRSKADSARFIEQLPKELVLPPKSNLAAKSIADCSATPSEIQWQVLSAAADVPESAIYYLESSATVPPTWTIFYSPDARVESPQPANIAQLSVADGKLLFQWANTPGFEQPCEQLRNCLLQASFEQQSRVCQLRGITRGQGSKVDFTTGDASTSFELQPLARQQSLFVELEPPAAGSFERDANKAISGKEIVFAFSDLPGAQAQARMVRLNDLSSLQIKISPMFEERRGISYKLTHEKIQDLTKRWNEGGNKATAQLAEAQASIVALQNQIAYLSKQTGGNGTVAAMRDQAILTANNRLRTHVERLPALQKRFTETTTRAKNAPQIKSFMGRHANTTMHYRIYAEVGEHRLMLVDASR